MATKNKKPLSVYIKVVILSCSLAITLVVVIVIVIFLNKLFQKELKKEN